MPNSIFALKVSEDRGPEVHSSLLRGEGRFGWSYVETANLIEMRERVTRNGWGTLSHDEQECYMIFLLEIEVGDLVVYINTPEWGKCTIARVAEPYFWRWEGGDFNHRFKVDPESVLTFDRNDGIVHPALKARLKLQGRYWRIYVQEEFTALVAALRQGKAGQRATPRDNLLFLGAQLQPILTKITECIQHNHPNYDLEVLMEQILAKVPGVKEVRRQGGAGDHGADLLLTVEAGFPAPGLTQEARGVVQVKSYRAEHWDTTAVADIRRAFAEYADSSFGLIVSSASSSTPVLENELDKLRQETGKPVGLLIGKDLASFVLRYAAKTILAYA